MNSKGRYFRCAYPDSYFQVSGDAVTYFAPQCPDGGPSQWSVADLERCAAKRPGTDGEMSADEAGEVRQRLLRAVAEHEKRVADLKQLQSSSWREIAANRLRQGVLFGTEGAA